MFEGLRCFLCDDDDDGDDGSLEHGLEANQSN